MRLLLINPNTTQHVTDRMVGEARRAAGARADVVGVTAGAGPAIIGSRAENALAARAALELAAEHHAGFDAMVLGVSLDTALGALREMLDVPVVGMAEAGLLTACMVAGRVGCLTLGPRLLPLYEELTQSYGIASRVARWRALDLPTAYGPGLDDDVASQVREACERMVREDGAEALVLCGAVLTGYAARIGAAVDVPVIDCIEAATRQALLLAEMELPPARAGSYARPHGRRLDRVSAQLTDWLGR